MGMASVGVSRTYRARASACRRDLFRLRGCGVALACVRVSAPLHPTDVRVCAEEGTLYLVFEVDGVRVSAESLRALPDEVTIYAPPRLQDVTLFARISDAVVIERATLGWPVVSTPLH